MPRAGHTLQILAATADHSRMDEVLAQAGVTYMQGYGAVRDLARRGVLRMQREGKRLELEPADPSLAWAARRLLERPPAGGWGPLLGGNRLEGFHVLARVRSVANAATVLDVTRAGLHSAAQAWRKAGLLRTEAGRHRPTRDDLAAFLDSLFRVQALHRMRQIDPAAELRWHLGPEMIYWSAAAGAPDGTLPAGPTALAGYGVTTFGPGAYRAVTRRSLDAADAALQTLLLGGDDAIHRSYAALVVERERVDLRRKAAIYGLSDPAAVLHDYLAGRHDLAGFLPWPQHEELRRVYGLT